MIVDASQLNVLVVDLQASTGRVGAEAAKLVRQTALDIEGSAKEFAPVRTGTLWRSIHHEIQGDGRFASMSAEIGTDVEYAPFVEYGTSRMAPQPYMRPAFDRHTPEYIAGMQHIAGDSVLGG